MITWGEIKADPKSLINPKFLLKAKLGNPTRMSLKDITAYWNHWVFKNKKGDPFSFGADSNSDKGKSDEDNDESKGSNGGKDTAGGLPASSPDHSRIYDNIPHPLLCKTTSMRTSCLQKLVPNRNETTKTFHALVQMVDTLEVSTVTNI